MAGSSEMKLASQGAIGPSDPRPGGVQGAESSSPKAAAAESVAVQGICPGLLLPLTFLGPLEGRQQVLGRVQPRHCQAPLCPPRLRFSPGTWRRSQDLVGKCSDHEKDSGVPGGHRL